MITVLELKALRAADHGRALSDGGSLRGFVHVAKDGKVSVHFKFAYKFKKHQRTLHCGTWPDAGIQEIRSVRDRARTIIEQNIDPVAQREAEREAKARQAELERLRAEADHQQNIQEQRQRMDAIAALQARMTVREMFDTWLRLELCRREDRGSETLRSFNADVFPLLGTLAAEDVKKAHIRQVLDGIQARARPGAPMVRTQKKTLSDLRQMFAFAMERDLLDADPTASVKKKSLGKDVERDRHFSEAELIEFYQKLPLSGLTRTSQLALLIQLSTVARIGEVLNASWLNVDLERRVWRLPNTKNGKDHYVVLSDYAVHQFSLLHQITGLTEWCFPGSTLDKPVSEKTVSKQVADRQRIGDAPLHGRTKQTTSLVIGEKWTPHDLRRTGATLMAELGALPNVVERCLNHTEESKVKRIYQRAQYEVPMREAWNLLGQRLQSLEQLANIKPQVPEKGN